jgi:hypothetical protein
MPLTQQERDDFDQRCYGMHRLHVASLVDTALGGPQMVAMSFLSDAQHMLEMNDAEEARKLMNLAKWTINHRLSEKDPSMRRGSLDQLI